MPREGRRASGAGRAAAEHGTKPGGQRLRPMHAAVLELQSRAGSGAVAAAFGGSKELFVVHGLLQQRQPELAPLLLQVARGRARTTRDPATGDALGALDSALDAWKDALEGKGELDEVKSLRLQMAMDRHAKLAAALSNVLKKYSDTSSNITQNLK